MTEQLTVFELILNATILVQIVMAMLAIASVISWLMIFQRWIFLGRVEREIDQFEDFFWSGINLPDLYEQLIDPENEPSGIESVFISGFNEFKRLAERAGADPEAVMQGTTRSMRVALTREEERLQSRLPFLASVGSISPYVGLFGTVIGIMNSFRSLANMTQVTLASVAPGISEALIATAMGLFAAIPAVIAYNRFAAKVEVLMKRYEAFADEFTSILQRALHTGPQAPADKQKEKQGG